MKQRLRRLPAVLGVLTVGVLLWGLRPPTYDRAFDLPGFGRLPVLNGGRIKPVDTIARNSLLLISGKQTLRLQDRERSALEWLMDVMFRPTLAANAPVFEIDHPEVLGLMGIQQTNRRRFTFAEMEPFLTEIDRQAAQADASKSTRRSSYETAVLNLENQITLYLKLQNTLQLSGAEQMVQRLQQFEKRPDADAQALEHLRMLDRFAEFYSIPVSRLGSHTETWKTVSSAILDRLHQPAFHPGVIAYASMADAWRVRDAYAFNQSLHAYQTWLTEHIPQPTSLAANEFVFNYFQPFYRSMVIYLMVFLLAFLSWMVWPQPLRQSAYALLVLAFAVHTAGLAARMVLQGRPPVTNLYSSAIFVGWIAVLLGIVLERLYRDGIGSMVASAIGFITLIIAHHLATSGDTLEMMRAVLDSNFWLATHVVCITVGYGSTFLSGFLAILFIFRSRFDPRWDEHSALALERMVYGVICFSTFFSFLGTILGGVWADQSWGRFWGWDPKENGALMIVLWNVFILHARLGGLAGRRTVMIMAVFGNVVTAFSWFGVNMLGIGLHSYGFMEKSFWWLLAFTLSQLGIMALGFQRFNSKGPRTRT